MKFFTKNVQGSISLFLSMIILLLVVLEGFLIDGSKVLAGKLWLSGAGDMALNAGLTYYDEALRDIYGLFATSKSPEELEENLKAHFRATLGEETGAQAGEYTDQLLGYIETVITSGWDGEGARRLLDLQLSGGDDGFYVGGVDGSQLSNPYVIKNEILQYMKYRGPASLGYGMLEKIYAFKELDKQQDTMEKKLDYEEKMSDVQEACEDAYGNIAPYNQLLENQLKPSRVEGDSAKVNKLIQEAVMLTWCYSMVSRDPFTSLENWRGEENPAKRNSHPSESRSNVIAAINASSHSRWSGSESDSSDSGELIGKITDTYDKMIEELGDADALRKVHGSVDAVTVALGYLDDRASYIDVYTTLKNWEEYYEDRMEELEEELDDADEDEDTSDIEEEMEELEERDDKYQAAWNHVCVKYDQFQEAIGIARETLKPEIHSRMSQAVAITKELQKNAARLDECARLGSEALDEVLRCMDELGTLGESWQNSISALSDGDIKTSMQTDYDNKAEDLDRDKINELKVKLANGRSYAGVLKEASERVKALSLVLYNTEWSEHDVDQQKIRLEGSAYGNDTLVPGGYNFDTMWGEHQNWYENVTHTSCLTDEGLTYFLVDSTADTSGVTGDGAPPRMDLSYYTTNMYSENYLEAISARDDVFFQYLERVSPKSDADDTAAKADAEEKKKNLLEQGKESFETSGLKTLDHEAFGTSAQAGDFDHNDSQDDKDVSQNAKSNTSGSADFVSGIGSLLAGGRDKLYLTEYATQMFSYYTVALPEGSSEVRTTLSGYALTQEHNQMYRSEVEYILWGNPDGNKDVQYTLATIFGIRFLLNSLYAFTGDPEIRAVSLALATSIAGWTGFGVPLVQSVIILSFALAESAADLRKLKAGYSVPIYKSTSTWVVKPSGLTKEAIEQAVADVEGAAKDYIYDKLNELTEATKGEFKEALDKYVMETADNVVETAAAAIVTPMQERVIGLVNVVAPTEGEIEAKVSQAVGDIRSVVSQEGDSVMTQAKLAAIDYFQGNYQSRLVSTIAEIQNNSGLSNTQIQGKVKSFFEDCTSHIKQAIQGQVKGLVDSASEGVNTALDSANEDLQKNVSEKLDEMTIRINCGISFADIGTEDAPGAGKVDINSGKGRNASGAALTMDYREYLWLFIAVKSMANEEDLLKRIANLTEVNLANSETKPSPDFKLSNAYTFIELKAKADLSTTFFAMPVPLSGGGGVTLGQDKYTIGYHGVLGY